VKASRIVVASFQGLVTWAKTTASTHSPNNADPFQVDAAGLPELVQQQRLQLVEHPALAHSSRRRQQVVAEPQPNSLAGNRLQGVLVRAMNTSAATQLRSGTRRGTPPRRRGGGGGSSGWMRCHS
jgi:hypothetical protein